MSEGFAPFKEICKRDGRILPFDSGKITEAIFKAARSVGGENYALAKELSKEVIIYLSRQTLSGLIPTVEEIQDAVEKVLIERGHARTAKAYILYRAKRTRIREAKSELMDVVKDILLEGKGREVQESTYSPAEKMHQIALAASQKYYLDNLLPPEIAAAHQRGSFYIHRLGYYSKSLDSLQIELFSLLKKGFGGKKTPPPDFLTAILRVAAIIQKSRQDMYGEVALPCFDAVLGKLLRCFKNKPQGDELARGLAGFVSYLSELSPFACGNKLQCSLRLGLDTSQEGREITRFFLNEVLNKKNAISQWPKIIFALKKGFNLAREDPNYDLYMLALNAAIHKGHPSFFFLDASYNMPMGTTVCYFSDGVRMAENRHGFPGGKGRGNLASLTINLPRLALTTLNIDLFFVELDRLLRLGVRQLLHRFEVLSLLKSRDLPFIMGEKLYLGSENLLAQESIKDALKNGNLTVSFVGLAEAVRVLLPEQGDKKEHSYALAARIAGHMFKRVQSFADEYDLNIMLRGGNDSRNLQVLVKKDREEFGLVKGVTDKDFYSSSFLLFQEDEGLENKIALEGEVHKCCPGGYASKLVLVPGMEAGGIEDLMLRLAAADIGFVSIS